MFRVRYEPKPGAVNSKIVEGQTGTFIRRVGQTPKNSYGLVHWDDGHRTAHRMRDLNIGPTVS